MNGKWIDWEITHCTAKCSSWGQMETMLDTYTMWHSYFRVKVLALEMWYEQPWHTTASVSCSPIWDGHRLHMQARSCLLYISLWDTICAEIMLTALHKTISFCQLLLHIHTHCHYQAMSFSCYLVFMLCQRSCFAWSFDMMFSMSSSPDFNLMLCGHEANYNIKRFIMNSPASVLPGYSMLGVC